MLDLYTYFDTLKDANLLYEQKGKEVFKKMVYDYAPELLTTADSVKADLFQHGWSVQNFSDLPALTRHQQNLFMLSTSCLIGSPTLTQPHNPTVAWPITPKATNHVRTTFSETNAETSFHTDSQYQPHPEKWFALFCIHADKTGGINLLQSVENIKSQLSEKSLEQLQKPFPFRVPTTFTQTRNDKTVETVWHPILKNNRVCYRKDTLADGLKQFAISPEQVEALKDFETTLKTQTQIHLQPGEVLFVDNHRMLHARTAFKDPNRLLYRVRMN